MCFIALYSFQPSDSCRGFKIKKYVHRFGVTLHKIANPGHATHEDLTELIQQISPKTVIPVHGKHSHLLETNGIRCYFPELGATVMIEDMIAGKDALAST